MYLNDKAQQVYNATSQGMMSIRLDVAPEVAQWMC